MVKNIGIWCVYLSDDGSLDTVMVAEMRIATHIKYECRFSDTADYRDDDGCLTGEGFKKLVEETADYAYMAHAA